MERQRVAAGTAASELAGYSRAIRAGQHVFVGTTAPRPAEGSAVAPDAYGQAARCLEIILGAMAELGAGPEHVVRTWIYMLDGDDFDEVARAHYAVFKDVRPVTSTQVVSSMRHSGWRIEIEAEAIID